MSKRIRHASPLLKSGKQIVNVGAMVGAKWSKDRLYLLFAGQQYMDIIGNEAELIWAALCRLSIDASDFGLGDMVATLSTNDASEVADA